MVCRDLCAVVVAVEFGGYEGCIGGFDVSGILCLRRVFELWA